MTKTRRSTPKFKVYHIQTGLIVLAGVSKTEAANFARIMDDKPGGKIRFAIAPMEIRKAA